VEEKGVKNYLKTPLSLRERVRVRADFLWQLALNISSSLTFGK
jgi:hypothetical protein